MIRIYAIPAAALCMLILPSVCHAYIDPGAGSQIVQIFIAVLVGGIFAIKSFWFRIKMFFTSRKKSKKTPDSEDGA